MKLVQLFNKRGKVADAAADAIQPVADDKIGRINSHMSEHFLELRAVGIFRRITFVFVDFDAMRQIAGILAAM